MMFETLFVVFLARPDQSDDPPNKFQHYDAKQSIHLVLKVRFGLQNSSELCTTADATDKVRAANKESFMCPYSRTVPKCTELQKKLNVPNYRRD